MIQLPQSATTAALAFALGALLGAGATYYLVGDRSEAVTVASDGPSTALFNRLRPLQPRDTASQEKPDVEIRYKTKTDTVRDTLRVPVPTSIPDRPAVSSRTPITLTSDRATYTYFDTREQRWEQRQFQVPEDRYQMAVYTVGLRRWRPKVYQAGLGVEAHLDPQWLPGAIEPFAEARVGSQLVLSTGLRWHIAEL